MGRMVLLRHVDGAEEHWDLLLERDVTEAGERRVVTFRLDEPVDLPGVAQFAAARIGDHRAVYLDYEGPLPAPGGSPNARGTVERVWAGACRLEIETPTLLDMTIAIGKRTARFTGQCLEARHDAAGSPWWFTRV